MSRRRTPRPAWVGVLAGVALVVSACGSSGRPAATTQDPKVPAPTGDLYQPPDPLPRAPGGTLIWATKVGLEINPPSTVWRILYHSRNREGLDIAVSGFALVPTALIPKAGRPVFAWAHGTAGLGDQCAPSHAIRDNLFPFGGQQLDRGAALVATDYAGLGTPGLPPSSGLDEGRAVLDSIRALRDLPNVGALGDVVLAGHSQGGRVALFAAEIASAYASELNVVGVLALAPGAELPALVDHLATSPSKGFVLMGAIGLRAAYPDVELSSLLTKSAIADVPRIESECTDATIARYRSLATTDVISHVPSTVPSVRRLLEQNSPGATSPRVPVFLGYGDADAQFPVALSKRLQTKYCAIHVAVTQRVYRGADHNGVVEAAEKDALSFIADRFDHHRAAGACA